METKELHHQPLLIETLGVILVTFTMWWVLVDYRSDILFLPVLYLIVERRLRHRSSYDLGFHVKDILKDLKQTMAWILSVVVGAPILTVVIAHFFFPDFMEHVISRAPMDINVLPTAILFILVGTLMEEIIFRGFIQERLGWSLGKVPAILIASLLFAGVHFSSGAISIVVYDLLWVFIDSFIYGIIYMKTKNLFASWIAHCLSDLVALIIILVFFA